MPALIIPTPADYRFEFSLQFLRRSPKEILHRVTEAGEVMKAIRFGEHVVSFLLSWQDNRLSVRLLSNEQLPGAMEFVAAYVREWLDLDSDLTGFYRMAGKDKVLAPLLKKYKGHRIMSYPDLFESLIWAVLGQQINLQFAYTLKQRFVEGFGTQIEIDGQRFYLFPAADRVSELKDTDLLPLQFSRQKSAYTVNIARAFVAGEISKDRLRGMTLMEAKETLMKIKGVGNWTANYALMRTFRYPDAFPLEDAGLHNALKNQLGLRKKPSVDRVKKIFKAYKGWEAYATVYLWKSL